MPTLLAHCLPSLPGFEGPKTYAAWPVWSGSTTKEIRFQPMRKKAAVQLWHRARDFDRRTRRKGHHGGTVGHAALQVLHALIFDCLDFASGLLDPSHAKIARKANVCERTVRNALRRLRDLGILNWVRRCVESWQDGRFVLEQVTNAYAILPDTQWRGYKPPPEPPAPASGTWGDHPPLPDVITQALADCRHGADMNAALRVMEQDPTDLIAAVCARLFRAVQKENSQ